MELRKAQNPAQIAHVPSSFVGIAEELPLSIDIGGQEELYRLQKRLGKLELLLEVYDIPLPPWK